MRTILSLIRVGLIPFIGFLLPFSAHAANNTGIAILTNVPGCNFQTGELKASCIPVFIGHLIGVVFSLVSVFFIINVMLAGYQIAKGSWGGDRTEGKERLQWAIVGLIVCVCSFLILDVVLTVVLS